MRLEAMAEAFNALIIATYLTKNSNFRGRSVPVQSIACFGQVTAVNDPRSIQLGCG